MSDQENAVGTQPEAIDRRIDTAIQTLMEKPVHATLMAEIMGANSVLRNSPHGSQAALVDSLAVLQKCYKMKANALFTQCPTAMSEILAIGLGSNRNDFPYLNNAQNLALQAFFSDLKRDVKPLIAKRINTYGREQLTADGLNRVVKQWFEVYHNAFQELMEHPKTKPFFPEIIDKLRKANGNKGIDPYFEFLLDNEQIDGADPITIAEHFSKIATDYTAPTANITRELVNVGSRIGLLYFEATPISEEARSALKELSDNYRSLVVTPYMDTPHILEESRPGRQ